MGFRRGLVPRLIALRAGPGRVPKSPEFAAHSRRVQTRAMADGPKIRLVVKKEGFGFLPETLRPRDPFLHCLCQYGRPQALLGHPLHIVLLGSHCKHGVPSAPPP